ncbi:hypothetical protein LCGC14_0918170 [marine sediment metagenome]|uniref:Uncharacterized protein n=1 Tax=marine sediment metagenome TaxID=412755 RepID=A0A0F9NWE3_9ZZZZ
MKRTTIAFRLIRELNLEQQEFFCRLHFASIIAANSLLKERAN